MMKLSLLVLLSAAVVTIQVARAMQLGPRNPAPDGAASIDFTNCNDVRAVKPNPDNQQDIDCAVCKNDEQTTYPCDVVGLCYCLEQEDPGSGDKTFFTQPASMVTPFTYCHPLYGNQPVQNSLGGHDCSVCANYAGASLLGEGPPVIGSFFTPCDDPSLCKCDPLVNIGPNIFNEGQCDPLTSVMAETGNSPTGVALPTTGAFGSTPNCALCTSPGDARYCDNHAVCTCVDQPFASCPTGVVLSNTGLPQDDARCQECYGQQNLDGYCVDENSCACEKPPSLFFECEYGAEPIPENPSATLVAWCDECTWGEFDYDPAITDACTTNTFCRCVPPPPPPNAFFGNCPSGLMELVGAVIDPPITQADCDACLTDPTPRNVCGAGNGCACVAELPNVYFGCPQVVVGARGGSQYGCAACATRGLTSGSANPSACSTPAACQCVTSRFYVNESCAFGVIPSGVTIGAPGGYDLSVLCRDCGTRPVPPSGVPNVCLGDLCACHPEKNLYRNCPFAPVPTSEDPSVLEIRECASCWDTAKAPPTPGAAPTFHKTCTIAGACKCGGLPTVLADAVAPVWGSENRDKRRWSQRFEEARRRREGADPEMPPAERHDAAYFPDKAREAGLVGGIGFGLRNRVIKSIQQALLAAGRGLL